MPEDDEFKKDEDKQLDATPPADVGFFPENSSGGPVAGSGPTNQSETQRIFMEKEEELVVSTESAISKRLHLDTIGGIKVTIKSASGGRRGQKQSAIPHSKKHEYIPKEARKLTPEEKEKQHLEEMEKIKKNQREEAKKAMEMKDSRELVEKGILPKVILVGFILLAVITLLLYFFKKI